MQFTRCQGLSSKIQRLAKRINWAYLESSLGHKFEGGSTPPLRLVVGLLYLQSINNLSNEEVIDSFQRSPEWQAFCGHQCAGSQVITTTALSIWSREIGTEGRKEMTKALGVPRRDPGETLH